MRTTLLLCLLLPFYGAAQLFPIKVNRQWGLMDKAGNIILNPRYDGIANYDDFGYARFQDEGQLGLLDSLGKTVLPARFEEIHILSKDVFILTENGKRSIRKKTGKLLLKGDFAEVKLYKEKYILYQKDRSWGLISLKGEKIIAPLYSDIQLLESGFFQVFKEELSGIVNRKGKLVLAAKHKEIRPKEMGESIFFFFKSARKWGAVNAQGKQVIPNEYRAFLPMDDNYIKLIRNIQNVDLYGIKEARKINKDFYGNYQAFSNGLILTQRNFRSGLMNLQGEELLAPEYQTILEFTERQYRAKKNDKWGIVKEGGAVILGFDYENISSLSGSNCTMRSNGRYGVLNREGKEIVGCKYSKIELKEDNARAFQGNQLDLLEFDERGDLRSNDNVGKYASLKIRKKEKEIRIRRNRRGLGDANFVIGDYEWVFDGESSKWGLRRNSDGEMQIKPTFDRIDINRNNGYTMVFMDRSNEYDFDRTTYRFSEVFGIVNNEFGRLTTPVRLVNLIALDFVKNPTARFITDTGRFGLIKKNGKIIQSGYAYIGSFVKGKARMSKKGRMSATLDKRKNRIMNLRDFLKSFRVAKTMVDFTKYDQNFRFNADLICDACEWGFVDTLGRVKVAPEYLFAERYINDVAIVQAKNNKWGLLDTLGQERIECLYDKLDFLKKSDEKAVRVAQKKTKYGLIDEKGHLIIQSIYDKIGEVQEGMIPVKRAGFWGFADINGREVIPCRFRKVKAFSQGLAAVQEGYRWGFVNRTGAVEIEATFADVKVFGEGLAAVKTPQGYGYIDKKGSMQIEPQFAQAFAFKEGIAQVKSNGRIGLIDTKGAFILAPKYRKIESFDDNGIAVVQLPSERTKYALIDRTGAKVGSKAFKKIGPFNDGLAAVQTKNGYGFINGKGALVVKAIYDKVSNFSEGKAWVQIKSSCGYIDVNGNTVVPLEYGKCMDFKDGVAVVYNEKRQGGLLGENGEFILNPTIKKLASYSEGIGLVQESSGHYFVSRKGIPLVGKYEKAMAFSHGIAQVRLGGKWGLINTQNIAIIPAKYDKIEAYQHGYAIVRSSKHYGLCNIEGEVIASPDYEYIEYAGEGLYRIEQGGKVGYFEQSGKWVWELKE